MACPTHPSRRATSWVAWQIGPRRARSGKVGEEGSSINEITEVSFTSPYSIPARTVTNNSTNRPASLWRRHILPFRRPSHRRRIHLLRRRQHPHISTHTRFRPWRRHHLPRPRRATRAWRSEHARQLPARRRTRRPAKRLRQQPRRRTRTRRPPLRLERRQAAAEPGCERQRARGLADAGGD